MITLLIVDDRAINREALSSLLSEHHYEVLEAENGEQAIEIARTNTPDLIITDIAMPKMDGVALVKRLQEDPSLRNIPIIFYSATYKAAEAMQLAHATSVKYVLTKPCEPEVILSTIEKALDPGLTLHNHESQLEVKEISDKPSKSYSGHWAKKDKLESINLRLTNLIEISLDMSMEHDIDKLMYILCKGGRQFLQACYAGIILKNSFGKKQYENFFISRTGHSRFSFDETELSSALKEVFLSEKTVCLHSPVIEVDKIGLSEIALPFSSLLVLPLKTSRSHYGKIYFINKFNTHFFTPSDQRFMMTLADKFSIYYENLVLSQKLEQMAEVVRSNTLGEMASSLAHEINQPLAAIAAYVKGCIHRIKSKKEDVSEIVDILHETALQAERAGEVIHRIKSLVRKGELYYETIDVNRLIEDTIHMMQNDIQHFGVQTQYLKNQHISKIDVDKIQLQQVLINLSRNAMEAMREAQVPNPCLRIESGLNNKRILIKVIDNGPGFSEHTANHLFDLYFTTKTHGMGLGLAICRSIIEAHSGQISASMLPSGGACFQIDLPIKRRKY